MCECEMENVVSNRKMCLQHINWPHHTCHYSLVVIFPMRIYIFIKKYFSKAGKVNLSLSWFYHSFCNYWGIYRTRGILKIGPTLPSLGKVFLSPIQALASIASEFSFTPISVSIWDFVFIRRAICISDALSLSLRYLTDSRISCTSLANLIKEKTVNRYSTSLAKLQITL